MTHPILQLFSAKTNSIHAHGTSLNLLLQTELAATMGNKELKEHIDYIVKRLPSCYMQLELDLPRFHGQFRDFGSRLYFALN